MLRNLLTVVLLLGAVPAWAQPFISCNEAAFRDRVVPFMPRFKCATVSQAAAGGVPLRFVWDASDQSFAPNLPAVMSTIDIVTATVGDAVPLWRAAAPLQTNAVTFIIGSTDTPIEKPGDGRFRGVTVAPARDTDASECIVILDLNRIWEKATEISRPRELAFVVAHEFAHCVQRWNVMKAMLAPGSAWWIEGIASLLGSVAVPDAIAPFDDATRFLEAIGDMPIVSLSYENVLFFQWMWNDAPGSVIDLMRHAPQGSGATPADQARALLKAAGGRERLAEFARKLVDNAIPNVAGGHPGPLKPRDAVEISDEGTTPLPGKPFTVRVRPVVFRNGRYLAELGPLFGPALGVRKDGDDWANDFPMESGSSDCDESETFTVVTMPLEIDELPVVRSLRSAKCGKKFAFSGPKVVDACLVGEWLVDNAAREALLASWVGAGGTVSGAAGTLRFSFRDDNTALVRGDGLAADIATVPKPGMPQASVHVAVSGADSGQWSAADKLLQYMAGGGTLSLDIVVTVGGMTMPAPSTAVMQDGNWEYVCDEHTLRIVYTGPAPVSPGRVPEFVLDRDGPDPRPPAAPP